MLATAGCKIESRTLYLDLRRAVAPIMKRSVACEWSINPSGVFCLHFCLSRLDSRNAGNCFREADVMPCMNVFGSMQPTLCRFCFTSRFIGAGDIVNEAAHHLGRLRCMQDYVSNELDVFT